LNVAPASKKAVLWRVSSTSVLIDWA